MMSCPIIYALLGLPVLYFLFRRLFPKNEEDGDRQPPQTAAAAANDDDIKQKSEAEIVFDNILSRRTVMPNAFTGEPVTSQELDMILEAGNWAPVNQQKSEPWHFTVFSGPEGVMDYVDFLDEFYKTTASSAATLDTLEQAGELHKLRMRLEFARKVWPTKSSHIIVIGMKRCDEDLQVPEWEEVSAVAMSIQNMQLMANALDVGGFWSSHTFVSHCRDSQQFMEWVGLDRSRGDRVLGAFIIGKVDRKTKQKIRSTRQSIKSKVIYKTSS